MAIYRGSTPLKAYKGDMQPVNIYKGAVKVAGWHTTSASGASPLTVDGDYNVVPDALSVDGKCEQVVSCWGTNLVTNGDFSNGTTGWVSIGGSATINGSCSYLCTQKYGYIGQTIGTMLANHTYYCAALVNSPSTLVHLFLQQVVSPYTQVGSKFVTTLNTDRILSLTAKPSVDLPSMRIRIQDDNASGWASYTVDNVLVIDLTAAFGAGKEPTAAQMDAIMAQLPNSWFDGSAQLSTDTTTYTPNSPSPTYPSAISTLTGNVGITGSNGEDSDTVTAALGTNVCASLPDGTKDTFDAVTGVLTKRVGKVVFDGSADEFWNGFDSSGVTGIDVNFSEIIGMSPLSWGSGRCSNLTVGTGVKANNVIRLGASDAKVYVYMTTGTFATADAWRAWLAANPVTVYYKLATPMTVQLAPALPCVKTGIKQLSVSADVVPTLSATVKSMD